MVHLSTEVIHFFTKTFFCPPYQKGTSLERRPQTDVIFEVETDLKLIWFLRLRPRQWPVAPTGSPVWPSGPLDISSILWSWSSSPVTLPLTEIPGMHSEFGWSSDEPLPPPSLPWLLCISRYGHYQVSKWVAKFFKETLIKVCPFPCPWLPQRPSPTKGFFSSLGALW